MIYDRLTLRLNEKNIHSLIVHELEIALLLRSYFATKYIYIYIFDHPSQKKYKQAKGDFEVFCQKIGWNTKDGEVERKKRWFGASEFIYDVNKAPEGHLPLTSALRGTSLIKQLLEHPVWDNDDWRKEP